VEHTSTVIDLVGAVTALLLVAAAVLALSKRLHLPFTVMLVVAGIELSEWAKWSPGLLAPLVEFKISPDVILFVFLPTLIFESSLHLDARELRRNLLPASGADFQRSDRSGSSAHLGLSETTYRAGAPGFTATGRS